MHSVLSINSEENADFRQAQTTKHCYWLFSVSVLKNSSVSASDTKTGEGQSTQNFSAITFDLDKPKRRNFVQFN